jgi:multidrug efflux pump subunit AcrA (membrane-fusion protein)
VTDRPRASWLVYALAALCAGAIAAAFLLVGAPSQSAPLQSRVVTVQQGIVQSTVSGSGNIQAATQLDLGFKTAGVVQQIDVTAGQQVTAGELIAELNPQSTEVTLEAAKASLQSAQATLAQEEETGGESSNGTSAAGSGTPSKSTSGTNASTTSEKPKQSLATREANLASARAAVKSDQLAVQSDEQAVAATKLLAPHSGTIVSLSGEVGESVSGGGTSKASTTSSSSSSGASAAGAGTVGGARSAAGSGGSTSSSTSSSSQSSPFAVLSDLTTMELVVPLSESEIVHVHVGAPATVTVEALEGTKLAAHVIDVATLSTSNSGVVSYDVTFQLDQLKGGLKPGMSASAEVVTKQAEGVNVPSTAITAGSVTVLRNGAHVRQAVVTGLVGNSSTVILSGLQAGEQIVLPVASSSSTTSLSSRLAGRLGGGGLGGGGLGGGLGGAFPRGGG